MKANNNSDKRHYKSYIHPRTSLPLLAVGCFALMGHSVHAATTFTGSVDNTWEDAGNWDAGLPDAADDVFFDTAATLTSTSTIRRLLLDGAGDILTINAGGDLTGAASKGFINASAQLIVNSGGSYTRAGTLDIRNGGGGITINDGGSFDLGTLRAADGTFAISGSTADVTIGTLRTVDPSNGGNNDTFTANNANLSLSNATLNITSLMEWDGASAVSIGAGSTLNLAGSGSHLITDGVVTSAGGVVEASGSGTQTLGFAISGDGSVEQNGTGTTTLSVANGHTGGTTISAGTLVLDDASALGTGTVTLSGGLLKDNVASNATYNNDIVVTDSTSTTIIDSAGGNSYFGGAVTGTGTLNFGGSGDGQVSGTIRWQTDMSGFTGTVNYDTKNNLNNFWLEPSTGGGAGQITTAKFNLTGDTSANRSMRVRGNWEIGELSGTGGHITGWNSTLTVNQSTETTYSGAYGNGSCSTYESPTPRPKTASALSPWTIHTPIPVPPRSAAARWRSAGRVNWVGVTIPVRFP